MSTQSPVAPSKFGVGISQASLSLTAIWRRPELPESISSMLDTFEASHPDRSREVREEQFLKASFMPVALDTFHLETSSEVTDEQS